MIYFTSDLHLFHDRGFIYKPRGFSSVQKMNACYIDQWKKLIQPDDDVFILGDFCLGDDTNQIKETVESLPGRIHLIRGNHDTDKKIEIYKSCKNVVNIVYSTEIVYNHRTYYLSHYITEVAGLESNPDTCRINLHGHEHTKVVHSEDKPYLINVSVDAQNNKFITFKEIEQLFARKVQECIKYL